MSVTPDGLGVSWTDAEQTDINQPHGLAYRHANHIAIAVRKRLNKEHVDFADSTVGGEHSPGGCAVMEIAETTANIYSDYTGGTTIGGGLTYVRTTGTLWCASQDGTCTLGKDISQVNWGPKSICKGGDFTWSGGHEFDGSVDFSSPTWFDDSVNVQGALWCASAIYGDESANIVGMLECGSTVDITKTLHCYSTMGVDLSAYFAKTVDVSQTLTCSSVIKFGTAADFTGTSNALDRVARAWAYVTGPSTVNDQYNVSHVDLTDPATTDSSGTYCISFTNAMGDANYAVATTVDDYTSWNASEQAAIGICVSKTTTGCRVAFVKYEGSYRTPKSFNVIVFGG